MKLKIHNDVLRESPWKFLTCPPKKNLQITKQKAIGLLSNQDLERKLANWLQFVTS